MLPLIALLYVARAGTVELVLNDPRQRAAPADTCDVRACTSLLQAIDGATRSIDIALYGMRNQTALLTALVRARARGVRVRAVVDRDVEGHNYYSSTAALVAAVGDVADDWEVDRAHRRPMEDPAYRCERPSGFRGPPQCLSYDLGDRCVVGVHAAREDLTFQGDIMHHKFAVIDERMVWTGSTNASDSGTGGYNANLVVRIDDPTVARWYTDEFEQMFAGRFHHLKTSRGPMETRLDDGTLVRAMFSPQDQPLTRAVVPLIERARQSIDIAVFFLTHQGVTRALLDAHRRGVRIRVILDATGAKNGYSKHEVLRLAGIPVKIEDWGGKMHAKSALVDGRVLVAGSMNWTSAGERGNDENTLLLASERLGRQYRAWFDALWDSIDDRWLAGRPDPESRDSGTACADRVDNDFDHLVDGDDPGCGEHPPPLPALPPLQVVPKVGDRCPEPGEVL